MLHDQNHTEPLSASEELRLTDLEREVLRRLGGEIAEIAQLPVHKEKARMWQLLNDKKSVRPMVWINEIPWHEMNVNDELTLQCTNPWARGLENQLRKTIYQWKHMPGDMIVDDFIKCPLVIRNTGFGIEEKVRIAQTDAKNSVVSREFEIQIREPEDIEKIKLPVVTHLEEETERNYHVMCDLFEGILPVKKVGQTHIWYTPWDFLIRWWGVENAMVDLIERPEMVHDIYERMVQAWMVELDQFDEQKLLSLDCNNTRVGSGGYGYTSELPGEGFTPEHVHPRNMWGCSNAQIFSSVSPEMHWEFAVEHDLKWLERFGMTYYGCCEPLDGKAEVLKRIPNLRKVSVSPWCDSGKAIENLGDRYVLSRKPNPAIFVMDEFCEAEAERQLREFLDKTERRCNVELIMKDISTVKYHPENLWKWEKLAMRIVEEYAR